MVGLAQTGESLVLAAFVTPFIGLHTADPLNATTVQAGTEVSGSAYARQSATLTNAGNNPTVASNNAILTYPTATGAWGTVSHFSVSSAVTAGNYYGSGALTTPKAVNSGDTARFAIGALTITVN